MQVISFKDTRMLKRGVWFSAAALIAFVAVPSVLNGDWWRDPVVSAVPLIIMGGFWVHFLRKTPFYSVVDEVVDCDDHLKVRRGGTEEVIPFASISTVEVSTYLRMHWVRCRLRGPTKLGNQVDFLPQASLWGNLGAIQRVALTLTARANRARGGIQ